MKELDFLEGINDLDAALLQEERSGRKRGGRSVILRFAAAAAAVLLLCGTVYAVVSRIEMKKTETQDEQGVEARVELPLVKWDEFSGEIRNAGEEIVRQYAEYTPEPLWSSYLADPGDYARRFDSLGEAAAYIGLADLKTPGFPADDEACTVTAHGDEEGRVDRVSLTAERIAPGEISVQLYVTVLTEYAQGAEFVSRTVWTPEFPADTEFQTYTTPGGNECRISVRKPEYESSYVGMTAYLAVGPAFCELNLGAVPEDESDRALEILHAWADALD